MNKSYFQSYLIVGQEEARLAKRKELANNLGINLNGSSPDVSVIFPQTKNSIGIDEIRNLKKHIFQKPIKNPFKLVIIANAHTLTLEAQNALLKIIEEPPQMAIMILESPHKARLLPTILSRVTIMQAASQQNRNSITSIMDEQEEKLLTSVSNIENPIAWLDEQIIELTNRLLRGKARTKIKKTTHALNLLKEAKQMIEANVNAKFVLINLVLQLKQ